MSRKISQVKALQFALDAMCAFNQGKLTEDEMAAIDVVADMVAKKQLYDKRRKAKYESDKYYKELMEARLNDNKK